MDREALERQEDLNLVLGELDAQALVAMDMRRAVIHRFDVHVAVGVQRGLFPVLPLRSRPPAAP